MHITGVGLQAKAPTLAAQLFTPGSHTVQYSFDDPSRDLQQGIETGRVTAGGAGG
jgi:hypothetical protein